jgi:hypothetical protein
MLRSRQMFITHRRITHTLRPAASLRRLLGAQLSEAGARAHLRPLDTRAISPERSPRLKATPLSCRVLRKGSRPYRRLAHKLLPEMLFRIYRLFFRFILFFLFFFNRTDDGASFCVAPSLLLRFFALWIVNHDSLLGDWMRAIAAAVPKELL